VSNWSEFESALDEVITAVEAGDWETAQDKHLVAELRFAKIPMETERGGARTRYREQLSKLGEQIAARAVSSKRGADRRRFVTTRTGYGE